MQERKRFSLFKAIKDIFRPRVEQKVDKSIAKHKVLRSTQKKKKSRSKFSTKIGLPAGTPKLFRKMIRAHYGKTDLKQIQLVGVLNRLRAMEHTEKQYPGRHTREIREHREWLAARAAR